MLVVVSWTLLFPPSEIMVFVALGILSVEEGSNIDEVSGGSPY